MTINQISVIIENKVGRLADMCRVLADAGVSLRALSISETADFGIARLIVDDEGKTLDALRRAKYIVKSVPVVVVTVPDVPGGMSEVVATLSRGGCDIEYSYAGTLADGKAALVFKFKDLAKALTAISDAGFATLG